MMKWKWLLAFVGLLVSANAHAHVSAVPFPEVGSLHDAHKAAFAIFQTALTNTPQITCALGTGVASVGGPCTTPPVAGVCNGDRQVVTRTTSITSGTAVLNVTVNTFVAGDAGKTIVIPGAGATGDPLTATILASPTPTAQQVTLSANASTTLSAVSTTFGFGTDDAPVFKQFNTWARANQGTTFQSVLNVPTSGNCWFATTQSISGNANNAYFASINNVLVEGSSSTWNSENGSGGYYWGAGSQCHAGLTDAAGCSARIRTVSAGASQIELTAASYAAGYISRFSATPGASGNWILLGGIDTQSLWNSPYGYPSNPVYYEWRQVTAICNNTGPCTGTATLTLDRPLTYTLLSTWPQYNSGNAFEADPGGPATIWAYPSNWDSTAEFKNITIKQPGQTNTNRRTVTLRNIITASTNGADVIPSQNENFNSYGGNYVDVEVDKIAVNVLYDGATVSVMKCQSNSIVNMVIRNSTFTNQLAGCGRSTDITDSSFLNIFPGATSYGGSTSFKCTRCNVTNFAYTSGIGQVGSDFTAASYTMSSGIIQFPNTAAAGSATAQRIFGPLPSNIFYVVGGSFAGTIGLVRPQNLTQDATNTYSQTNEAGGFPSWSGGLNGFRVHPAPQFTSDNSTGDPILVAMNTQNGATALAPMCSYSSKAYTPSTSGAQTNLCAMGKIVSLTIDVTVASTASGALTLNPTGQFHNETVAQSSWTAYDWVPTINLKQAGRRVITPSGTTCNGVSGSGPGGSCSGDTCTIPSSGCYALPEAVWIKDSLGPIISGTMNGTNPQFTVTIQTDQGVVP